MVIVPFAFAAQSRACAAVPDEPQLCESQPGSAPIDGQSSGPSTSNPDQFVEPAMFYIDIFSLDLASLQQDSDSPVDQVRDRDGWTRWFAKLLIACAVHNCGAFLLACLPTCFEGKQHLR